MSNIILGDEINRATPRTQSALLEAMQERQVTVDITTRSLPRPFLVIATQNPIELEGTFPLPEAQLDRFLFRLNLNYPTEDEEKLILSRFQRDNPLDNLPSVLHVESLVTLQGLCREVYVEDSLRKYVVSLVRATRVHPNIELGASPRASLSLHLAAQAMAAIRGRSYVIPDDVKYLAIPTLAHRIILRAEARLRGRSAENIIEDVVTKTPVPVEASS
jgi:MoxR-like ATPase